MYELPGSAGIGRDAGDLPTWVKPFGELQDWRPGWGVDLPIAYGSRRLGRLGKARAAMTPTAPAHCDLLLTGGIVVTVDDAGTVYDPGSVAVIGSRIVAVGPEAELAQWHSDTVLDCRGKVVLPGLIDGHNHLYQALARGLGEGMSIVPWLCEFMWPYSIAMTPADAVAAARLGAVEALRAGTTTVIDNHYAPSDLETTLAVADVIEESGLRGAVARGVIGERTAVAARRGQPAELFRYSAADELSIMREAMRHRPRGSKVEIWPAPSISPTSTRTWYADVWSWQGNSTPTGIPTAVRAARIRSATSTPTVCGRCSGWRRPGCWTNEPPSPMPSGSTTTSWTRSPRRVRRSPTTRRPTPTSPRAPSACASCGTAASPWRSAVTDRVAGIDGICSKR